MKARDIIYGALRLIQEVDNEEGSVSPEAESNALLALNMMVASWSARDILLYATIVDSFILLPSKNMYTIGDNSVYDFDTVAPQKITNLYTTDSGIDTVLDPISENQYFNISQKSYAGYPTKYYYKYGYPYSLLFLWPVPTAGMQITFASYKNYPVIPEADIETEIYLPSPYMSALKYNLALELAPEYATDPPAVVISMATRSLKNIILLSTKEMTPVEFDPAITTQYSDYM